jgi:hypothetical protein
LEQREKQLEDFNEMVKEEIELKVHTINLSDVPEKISVKQMEVIAPLIVDEA